MFGKTDMQRQLLYQLNSALFAAGFLYAACPAEAQVQATNYSAYRHYVGSSGYGCPCPQCTARTKDYALNDLIHGFQAQPWVQWLIDDSYYSRSADHGFARVTKRPIQRQDVTYTRYWPTRWYGARTKGPIPQIPRYPTVALPTDTTQLGYYYQQVPQWQPRPGMIPPVPRPRMYHVREVSRKKYDNGFRVMGRGPAGAAMPQPVAADGPAPAVPALPPAPAPPSQDLDKSAENTPVGSVKR